MSRKKLFLPIYCPYSSSDLFSVHVLPLTLLLDPENPVQEGRNGMNTPYLSFVAVLFPLPSRYCHHHVDRVLLSGCLTRLASERCCQTPQRQAMFLYSLLLITIFLDLSTYLETASVYVGTCTRISNTSTHVNNDRDRGCWKPHCKVAYSLSLKLVTFALLRTIWRFPITHGPCLLVLTSCLSFFLPSYPCICPDLFKQT